MADHYEQAPLHKLLHQAVETEQDGIEVYETAITAADDDVRRHGGEPLDETRTHDTVWLEKQ